MRIFLIAVIPIFISACKSGTSVKNATVTAQKKPVSELIIEGDVKNVPDGKLYLAEAHHWEIKLDSTEIKNGHFAFRYPIDSSFVPFKASISLHDSTTRSGIGIFVYRNHILKRDGTTAFMLEKGTTRIEGDYKSKRLRVFAGKETDVMYKNMDTDFAWLGNSDGAKRTARIVFFKKEIETNPFSYYLLLDLLNAKEQYSEAELADLLRLFNANVQQSKLGARAKTYLANRTDLGKPHAALSLLNSRNETHAIINKDSRLNMLVFWASWCGPCRKEIPQLREIYAAYRNESFGMASVSIDKDPAQWHKALQQENMGWPQYITDSARREAVMQQFGFAAIPLVVFTDNAGREIRRFNGYEPENKAVYMQTIDSILHNK